LVVGQFTKDKNQKLLIRALTEFKRRVPSLQAVFVGGGPEEEHCKALAREIQADGYAHFLGFRQDVPDLCKVADIHVSSSVREGQGINNIEAMASGCALVVSDIRGHRDVCQDGRNGYLFSLAEPEQFIEAVERLANDASLRESISQTNLHDAEKFSIQREVNAMADIYRTLM
ncbi:MAG: glycosyltransferase, partial [Muribaculaceae bacterium]|nr:glycosyltransferase [Muribaculaceae bacterium]